MQAENGAVKKQAEGVSDEDEEMQVDNDCNVTQKGDVSMLQAESNGCERSLAEDDDI